MGPIDRRDGAAGPVLFARCLPCLQRSGQHAATFETWGKVHVLLQEQSKSVPGPGRDLRNRQLRAPQRPQVERSRARPPWPAPAQKPNLETSLPMLPTAVRTAGNCPLQLRWVVALMPMMKGEGGAQVEEKLGQTTEELLEKNVEKIAHEAWTFVTKLKANLWLAVKRTADSTACTVPPRSQTMAYPTTEKEKPEDAIGRVEEEEEEASGG